MLRTILALLLLATPCWSQFGARISNQTPAASDISDLTATGITDGYYLRVESENLTAVTTPAGGGGGAASGYATWTIQIRDTAADTSSDHALSRSPAPTLGSSNQAGVQVAYFDDSTDEGRVLTPSAIHVPADATDLRVVRIRSHPESAGGGDVYLNLHCREVDNSDTWSTVALGNIYYTASVDPTVVSTFADLDWSSDLSCTPGEDVQLEISRDADNGSDDLADDWELISIDLKMVTP